MPPKKKPEKKKVEEEEPVGYNIAIMNRDQLVQYAKLLEREIENMREHCNFYQKVEDELAELLRVTEQNFRYAEDSLLLKDVELEKINEKLQKDLKKKREWPKYMDYTNSAKIDQISSETENLLEQEKSRHLQETERLERILQERDQKLEALRVKIEMARRENLEKNEATLREMDKRQKNLLEQGTKKFNDVIEDIKRDFSEARETMEQEAREGKMMRERWYKKACEASKQKLQSYYKEVTRKDLEVIKKLKQEIGKVEDKIKTSKVQLQEAREENEELQEVKGRMRLPRKGFSKIFTRHDSTPAALGLALRRHSKTEKLVVENQRLEEEIKKVTEQTCNLRRQFTLALKKVRDSAEMKASILERKLNFILDEETRNDSPESYAESRLEDAQCEKVSDSIDDLRSGE